MILLALVTFLAGVAFVSLVLQDNVNAITNNNSKAAMNITLTPDQLAAGGPLPGNLSQIEEEQKCIAAEHPTSTNVPWYPTIANTEHGGSERTAVFPCAHFNGSYTKPNQVYAYQSPFSLGGVPSFVVTRGPNEIYVSGGAGNLALPGPVIAKLQAGSLREVWDTPLSNNNVTGNWLITGATNFPADGSIAVSQGQYLYKVNASTGAIEKVVSLPTGKSPPNDSNFDGMNAFSDGTEPSSGMHKSRILVHLLSQSE